MRFVTLLFGALLCTNQACLAAINCPEAPTIVGHDVVVKTRGKLETLGKLASGNFDNETSTTLKNAVAEMQNGDKVMIASLLLSVSCQVIRDSSTLTDDQKLDRIDRSSAQIISMFSPQKTELPIFKHKYYADRQIMQIYNSNKAQISLLDSDVVVTTSIMTPDGSDCSVNTEDDVHFGTAFSPISGTISVTYHHDDNQIIVYIPILSPQKAQDLINAIFSASASQKPCDIGINVDALIKITFDDAGGISRRTFFSFRAVLNSMHRGSTKLPELGGEWFTTSTPSEFEGAQANTGSKLFCHDTQDCAFKLAKSL